MYDIKVEPANPPNDGGHTVDEECGVAGETCQRIISPSQHSELQFLVRNPASNQFFRQKAGIGNIIRQKDVYIPPLTCSAIKQVEQHVVGAV
jgi:hypothetical protein